MYLVSDEMTTTKDMTYTHVGYPSWRYDIKAISTYNTYNLPLNRPEY